MVVVLTAGKQHLDGKLGWISVNIMFLWGSGVKVFAHKT